MGIWEALMMAAFGFSWPMQIMKTYKTKNPAGKSLMFLFLIFGGYAAGIVHKLTVHYNWVFWIYLLNLLMVGTDLTLTLYYKNRLAKKIENND
jgi:hypothetical protein